MSENVYLYVMDTMSDWEIGYLTAELNSGRYFRKGLLPIKVMTVGINKCPIITMGGLSILPDTVVEDLRTEDVKLLILPGGETWLSPEHNAILDFAKSCMKENRPVGAICGATFGLASHGLLESYKHTSNDLNYLKMIMPSYTGEKLYEECAVVSDWPLITASGIAPLEFAYQVIKGLNLFSQEALEAWYALNKTQEVQHFYKLMEAMSSMV